MICPKNVLVVMLALTFFKAPVKGADVAASNALPEGAKEERKTPAEWLDVIKAENAQRLQYEAAHPDETKLLLGACWENYPNEVRMFPAKYQEAVAYYNDWWKREGEAAFNKWRKDGFSALTDPHYLILLTIAVKKYGTYLYVEKEKDKLKDNQDLADYMNRIVTRGKALVLQGCSGEGLSRRELDELRLFAVYQNRNYDYELMLPTLRGWMPGAAPGMPAPDFTLPQMEEVLNKPTYSDQDPSSNDFMNQYRPCVLTELLKIMDGYEATADKKPGSLVRAKPYETALKNPVTLSSFRGKKPVLFMCADPTDTWCWCGRCAPLWEPLYRAIKDRVEVFFVHTTVHDWCMWSGAPWSNQPIALTWAFHPLSQEARARTAKMCYMLYPTLSVPFLLDDTACHVENAYLSDGGWGRTYLVDKEGMLSFMGPLDESDHYERSCNGNADGVELGALAPIQGHMSLVECNLKALLDAGGVWNKEIKHIIPDWHVSPMLANVPLTAVDGQAGTLTVTDKEHKPLVIAFDNQTRMLQNGKRTTSADLKPGQTVQVMYQADAKQSCGRMARLVLTAGSLSDPWTTPVSWVPAEVSAIDLERRIITVKMTLALDECKGPGLWKSADPVLFSHYNNSTLSNSVPKTFEAVAAAQAKPLVLHTDRYTEFLLNGMTAHLSDLKVGDKIGFDLVDGFASDDVWPHFIRVYRY